MMLKTLILPLFLAVTCSAFSQERIDAYNKAKTKASLKQDEARQILGYEEVDNYNEEFRSQWEGFGLERHNAERKAKMLKDYNAAKVDADELMELAEEVLEYENVDNYREEFADQWSEEEEEEDDDDDDDDEDDDDDDVDDDDDDDNDKKRKFSAKKIEAYNEAKVHALQKKEYAEELLGFENVDNYREEFGDQWTDFDLDKLGSEKKAKLIEAYNMAKADADELLDRAEAILGYAHDDSSDEFSIEYKAFGKKDQKVGKKGQILGKKYQKVGKKVQKVGKKDEKMPKFKNFGDK